MKDKRLKKPQHVRQLMNEQINRLRRIQANTKELPIADEIKISKAIAYLSSVALTSIKEGEIEEKLAEFEKIIKESQGV